MPYAFHILQNLITPHFSACEISLVSVFQMCLFNK